MSGRNASLALIGLVPDFVALFDRNKVITYVSPAVDRVTGYKPEEMVGKRFDELLHPEDVEGANRAFASVVGGHGIVNAQTRFRGKDGSWITLESLARNCLEFPDLEGILVSSRDISRHIDLEATLRQSLEKSADLFENAPCGYHSVDAAGVFLRVNRTELQWLQRTRDELVGRARFADLLSPESQPRYWESFGILKIETRVRNVELTVVRNDGTTFPALLQSIAILDPQGEFVESRTTVYDISERQSAEQALEKEALARLSHREREVLNLVVEGRSSKQIAGLLHLSLKSVDTYRSRLMVKLNLDDVPALVRFAVRQGVIKA